MTTTPDIFLSYNREDAATAKRFADAFAAEGLSVWWDATLRSGEAYDEVTEAALRGAKAVVVLWSPRSVVSRWVRAEATIADRCKTLVPVMIEPCERPIMFELTQTAELTHWDGRADDDAWLSFLADVHRYVGRKADISKQTPQPPPERETTPKLAQNKIGIAIMPLVDKTSAQDQAELISGLSEEIEAVIGRLGYYLPIHHDPGNRSRDLVAIARAAGVNYVLDGSVQAKGHQLRITTKLVAAISGEHLHTSKFDGLAENSFALQDHVAMTIAAQLEGAIMAAEVRRIAELPEQRRSAFEFFLLARTTALRVDQISLEAALALAEKAEVLDPSHAETQAMVGWCHALLYQQGWSNHPTETRRRGIEHCRLALSGSEHSYEVLSICSTAMCCLGFDLTAVDAMIDRARAKDPEDDTLIRANAWNKLLMGGRPQLAIDLFDQSLRLDSTSPIVVFNIMGQALGNLVLRNFDDAARLANETISRRLDYGLAHAIHAAALAHSGKIAEAQRALAAAPPETPFDIILNNIRNPAERALFAEGLKLAGAQLSETGDTATERR